MKNKCRFTNISLGLLLAVGIWSCDTKEKKNETEPQMHEHQDHDKPGKMDMSGKQKYTCPMPEDSVFSDKPGTCPKCGMDLIKVAPKNTSYTCPMHPEVISDKPGDCPKCGMDLEPVGKEEEKRDTLAYLTKPTNHFVISNLKPILPSGNKNVKRIPAEGYLTYDPNKAASISARVSGRIEKLYVKYNFQKVNKGAKLLDIYSPELLTAQNEFLYLLKNGEVSDDIAIKALQSKLTNLGMNENSLTQLKTNQKASPYISVYSTSSGHIHFLNSNTNIAGHALGISDNSKSMESNSTSENDNQVLREGDYVKTGDVLFTIADQTNIWALLKVLPSDISSIKKGEPVELSVNGFTHEGKVDFIEKSFESGSDFYTVRVYLNAHDHNKMKIGSLVKGYISIKQSNEKNIWVPALSVLSLGKSRSAVFVKKPLGYEAKEIMTGIYARDWVEITSGLSKSDSIAPVASYLVDSEAFIETE
ncbi:MAG: efflux RND transporter periplasmic adaptor subunit [Opitutaceae bacterium]|nr:efflux RND transporter periplasmic adaptor subunit [Cytophagales bacterium]